MRDLFRHGSYGRERCEVGPDPEDPIVLREALHLRARVVQEPLVPRDEHHFSPELRES